MRTKKPAAEAETLVPHLVEPTAVYTLAQTRRALGLAKSSLSREIRQGRLRVAKRAGKYYFLGSWLLEWLIAGEVKPRTRAEAQP